VFGFGVLAQIPNPQSPIPNPQSPLLYFLKRNFVYKTNYIIILFLNNIAVLKIKLK
jgi:hypothetical protein